MLNATNTTIINTKKVIEKVLTPEVRIMFAYDDYIADKNTETENRYYWELLRSISMVNHESETYKFIRLHLTQLCQQRGL